MNPRQDPDMAGIPQRPTYKPDISQPIQQQPVTQAQPAPQSQPAAPYGQQPAQQYGSQISETVQQPARPSVAQAQPAGQYGQQYMTGQQASVPQQQPPSVHASSQFGSFDQPAAGQTTGFAGPGKPKRSKRKAVVFSLLAVVLLAGAGSAYALLFYLPNRPTAVYSTGLDRTGMAIDKLTQTDATAKDLVSFENSRLSGDIKVTGPDSSFSGSFDSKYDKDQSDSSFGVKISQNNATGAASTAAGAESFSARIMTDMADGAVYPDTYFKLSGLKMLGLDSYVPGLSNYDGKWVSVTGDFIASMVPVPTTAEDKKSDFTSADAAALAKVAADTTRQYVFTSDAAKAVLVQRQFKGTEKVDGGITANRYEVGIDKQHAKDYCKALITNVTSADAFKRIPNIDTDQIETLRSDLIKDCQESIDKNLKDSDSFDMWVDKKTKLIHKIRLVDTEDKTAYLDIGQSYSGKGSAFPFFARLHSDKEKYDAKLTLTLNDDTEVTTGKLEASFDTSGAWKIDAGFTFQPYKEDVKVDKPKDAVPLQDVFKQLGIPLSDLGASSTGTAATTSVALASQDTERVTDIKAIQGQLEAAYAKNGSYPGLAELNSTSWRAANMKGIDAAALAAPGASGTPALANIASLTTYAYRPSGCTGGSKCSAYVLEALLSTGEKKTLASLNT